jgi:hypothetical protein
VSIKPYTDFGQNRTKIPGKLHEDHVYVYIKVKAKVKLSHDRPGQVLRTPKRLRLREFLGIWRWQGCQPYSTAIFTHRRKRCILPYMSNGTRNEISRRLRERYNTQGTARGFPTKRHSATLTFWRRIFFFKF